MLPNIEKTPSLSDYFFSWAREFAIFLLQNNDHDLPASKTRFTIFLNFGLLPEFQNPGPQSRSSLSLWNNIENFMPGPGVSRSYGPNFQVSRTTFTVEHLNILTGPVRFYQLGHADYETSKSAQQISTSKFEFIYCLIGTSTT